LIRSFGNDRPAQMQNEIGTFFSLGAPVNLTLKVAGSGNILVHNLPLPSFSDKSTGVTFKAYSTVPLTLMAAGTGFKGWKVNGVSDGSANPRTFDISGDTTIEAEF
jgi:hypothetical protein